MTEPRTATVVKIERWLLSTAKVYRLSHAIQWRDEVDDRTGTTFYVVVSARPFVEDHPGTEAIAWACDAEGEFIPDRYRCTMSVVRSAEHDDAVRALGFDILPSDVKPPEVEPMTKKQAEEWNQNIAQMLEHALAAGELLRKALSELELPPEITIPDVAPN